MWSSRLALGHIKLLECIQKLPYENGRAQHDCFHGSVNMFALRATEFVLVLSTSCTYQSHTQFLQRPLQTSCEPPWPNG